MQKFPMTAPGLQRLADELRQLKSTERPSIIRQIAEARTHGDLSENAEYHAARERQSFVEGRIADGEPELLAHAFLGVVDQLTRRYLIERDEPVAEIAAAAIAFCISGLTGDARAR